MYLSVSSLCLQAQLELLYQVLYYKGSYPLFAKTRVYILSLAADKHASSLALNATVKKLH